jgi:Mce-associated membrane protein
VATAAHAADELTRSKPSHTDTGIATVTADEPTPATDLSAADGTDERSRSHRPGVRSALSAGLIMVLALGALAGWLGFGAFQMHQTREQSAQFVAAGRQAALNLTSIDYTDIDADLKRILDSSTGAFHDDFKSRSQAFSDVVKKAQSKSEGTITAAGLESQSGDQGQVLVTVSVKTRLTGQPEPQPRGWRMRIGLTQVGNNVEVNDVQFVP